VDTNAFPDRRRFLKESGAWALGVLAGCALPVKGLAGGRYPRPALEGACLQPWDDTERTLAAVLDTVVPGPSIDPEGAPGALEGCGLNLMLDDAYPFRGYAALIARLMDQTARQAHGQAFVDLAYEPRLEVLVKAEEALPLLRLAYRAIRSAFYGGAYNGQGLAYLHYPGPNLGWRHLPEFSFRKAVCKEKSETGWLP
jgi:hypothetical protein